MNLNRFHNAEFADEQNHSTNLKDGWGFLPLSDWPGKVSKIVASRKGFAGRAFVAILIGAGALMLLLVFWYAVDVLLLVFAGILFGVFLQGLTGIVSDRTGLSQQWSLLVALFAITGLIIVAVWLLYGRVAEQASELAQQLPRSVENLSSRLEAYSWGRRVLAEMPTASEALRGHSTILGRITGIFSGILGAVLNFAIIVVLGCYIAAEPRLYSRGILRLIPLNHRDRAQEVLSAIFTTLSRWLVGRLILMTVNGALTALGLWVLGMPIALTLGLLTGVLNFIPNFGPLIAGVPAVLIALTISPQTALYVGLLYIAVQSIDGYIFTPLVNRRSVELPPVLTITAQMLLGVLVGSMGVVLAGPLTAMLIVVVRMLYLEDALGDSN